MLYGRFRIHTDVMVFQKQWLALIIILQTHAYMYNTLLLFKRTHHPLYTKNQYQPYHKNHTRQSNATLSRQIYQITNADSIRY